MCVVELGRLGGGTDMWAECNGLTWGDYRLGAQPNWSPARIRDVLKQGSVKIVS